jgi:hypothetical protein
VLAFQFLLFGRGYRLEFVLGDAQLPHNPSVHHPGAVAGDGAHGQLLPPGDAQFADRQHVQGCSERPGHLEADRDATARQGQHHHLG